MYNIGLKIVNTEANCHNYIIKEAEKNQILSKFYIRINLKKKKNM